MQCHRLAERISQLDPELPAVEVARLCLLMLTQQPESDLLEQPEELARQWKGASFRLKASADQHAAMTAELETLWSDGPQRFSPEQIWILVRAIKVQSQILDLYSDSVCLT